MKIAVTGRHSSGQVKHFVWNSFKIFHLIIIIFVGIEQLFGFKKSKINLENIGRKYFDKLEHLKKKTKLSRDENFV